MKTTMQRAGHILIAMMLVVSVYGQQIEVSGRVFDEDKKPIIGATVMNKATRDGTVSNIDGKYRIKTRTGDTLVFMYVGYIAREIEARKTHLDVYLKPDLGVLEEVTVVGFGTQKRASIVGAVTQMVITVNEGARGLPFHLQNSEEYEPLKENRFFSVSKNPLSTFSLDVDVASYGNIRRMINQGQLPERDAVRVEEMINYFDYDYPEPTDGQPVGIIAETAVCPWNRSTQLVRIGIKAKEIASEMLPAGNFVFLIDVSGSMMDANKLPLVKASMKLLVNNLRPEDRVAIVAYAGAAGEALPSTSGADKQKIMEALDNLQAGGSTAGGAGIQLAYKIAEGNLLKEGNNRVILCTDGDFNVGVSSAEGLESLIEQKRRSGIYLTVLGYGMGNYKDNKLQTLAQKGNGNHAYIDNLQEANKVLVNEFGSTMAVVAKDVKLQVEFNPNFVNAYRLIGYESRLLEDEDFNDDTKDAGELGPGHTITALYEIVPVGVEIPVGKVDPLKYQQQTTDRSLTGFSNTKELLTVKLRYKKPDEDISRKLELPVSALKKNLAASTDFNFVMAVAMFGQMLRDSAYTGDATYEKVVELASKGLDDDPNGYRREFIRLVEAVKQLEL